MIITQFLHDPHLLHIDRIKLELGEVLCFLPKANNVLIIVGFIQYNGKPDLTKRNRWKCDREIDTKLPMSIVMVCKKNERSIVKKEVKKLLNLKEEEIHVWRLKDFNSQEKWCDRFLREKRTD